MSPHARAVRDVLHERQGYHARLTSAQIGAEVGLAPKQVVDAVHELRNEYHLPIGSRPGTGGFWWIVDKREAQETHDELYRRALAALGTCKTLRSHFQLDQPRLLDVELSTRTKGG